MNGAEFIPLTLATLGLIWASFTSTKKNRGWLIIASIIWALTFLFTVII